MKVSAREFAVLGVLLLAAAAGPAWWRARQQDLTGQALAAAVKPGDITMFSTASCLYCTKARRWFSEHRIPFTECDIEKSADCQAGFLALGAVGTPTFAVRGKRVVGFSPPDLLDAVGRTPASEPRRP